MQDYKEHKEQEEEEEEVFALQKALGHNNAVSPLSRTPIETEHARYCRAKRPLICGRGVPGNHRSGLMSIPPRLV